MTGTEETPVPEPGEGGRGPFWRRAGVALVLLVAAEIALSLTWLVAAVQVGWLLVTGGRNVHLAAFGASLSAWASQVVRFVSCASEERPFPWAPWPKEI
jgi:hypothetical protein